MNVLEELKKDEESCKKYISLFQRLLTFYDYYSDLFTKEELIEQLNYYRDMQIFIKNELKHIEKDKELLDL